MTLASVCLAVILLSKMHLKYLPHWICRCGKLQVGNEIVTMMPATI
jgi:hypothetical protein